MPIQDQAVWQNVNVIVNGKPASFSRGELLPDPADAQEASQRDLLRLGGALRVVEVVYTPEELAEAALTRASATAERESALDVDPDLPSGAQMPGTAAPGRPTLAEPSGSPVVLADKAPASRRATAKGSDQK